METPMADTPTDSNQALRQRAEEKLSTNPAIATETLSPEETRQLLHELRVHQIELEMQNEELRRTQHELEGSRTRYFELYDLAPVGYLTISENGLIREANLAAATMFDMARGALVNQPISRVILNEDQDIYYLNRKQLLKTGEPQACELRLEKRDGTAFWAHLTASVEQDPSTGSGQAADDTPLFRVVLKDISKRKRAEEALRDTNRQLKEQSALAQEMAAKAEEANAAKSQFLANMSHELRTPMTGVLGMLDIVLLGSLEAEQREFIESAHTAARSLVRILNDILDMAKIEAGKFSLEAKPFSVRKCVESTFNILIPAAKSKGLDFVFTVADDVPDTLVGDKLRLNQILTNLAGNAIKFTEQGKVEICVVAGGSAPNGKREVTFTVSDTGIGIPDDKKESLFRVFSQVDESHTRSYGGTGLGLAISKEIVECMGGTIGFESEEGVGSLFSFTVPMEEAILKNDALSATESLLCETITSQEGERIPHLLLVEDEPHSRKTLGLLLKWAKYSLDFAENGLKAVEMWEKGKYDLILMDVQMPLMNGFEATLAIREIERERGGHTPIVAMTAHAFKEDEERCLAAGMDYFIAKPIDIEKTIQVIGEILKK
jgi:PAS domain S-box-containing protein